MKRLLITALLVGCKGGDPDPAQLTTRTEDFVSTEAGDVVVEIDVADQASFLVTGDIEQGAFLLVQDVKNPQGETVFLRDDWLVGPNIISWSVWPNSDDVVFNWPIRGSDGVLRSGVWELTMVAVDIAGFRLPLTEVSVTTQLKQDDEPDLGISNVHIVYAGDLGDDPTVVEDTEAAVEYWTALWLDQGLTLSVRYGRAPSMDPALPFPAVGSRDFEDAARKADDNEITMIVGETIDDDPEVWGHAGTIPNALVPTRRSVVAVAWLSATGPDGKMNAFEQELFGQTMAHEIGHHSGLFHPVEVTDWHTWDAIEDTPECDSSRACEEALPFNLMFPYVICDGTTCNRHSNLTDGQRRVVHNYTGTL